MKKIFLPLFAVIAACTFSAQAQIYVGGGIGFGHTTNEVSQHRTEYNTNFSFAPEVGYNINDQFAVGAAIGFTYRKNTEEIKNENITVTRTDKSNSFSFAPYGRYTFLKGDIVNVFVDGQFVLTRTSFGNGGAETGFGINIRPGVAFKMSQNISLVASFGLFGFSAEGNTTSFNMGVDGSALLLGLYYSL